ncbi:hypothetical protein QA649_06630 [Bradyrhizobium sp. CB1717]|uniref:hypothetical protein n=1 Tax=Bradyrhizobium sp. CB1717 TaxID=3039154 RepID=UPI0024B18C97|nr:hypothetical protein [Bradyrhizobium sp. CB1717]WFU25881.1 hypothetical protein QA649_06630 [Bradyrhizobium sp. CB1717]
MPVLIKGAANAMQTVRSQADTRTAQGNSAQQKGGRVSDRLVVSVIPGRCAASNPESRDSGFGFAAPE